MRQGASWRYVNILNISSRGLLIHSAAPPERRAYVEVCRGRHVVVARVIWSNQQRFGVSTQDRLDVDEFIRQPDRPGVQTRSADGAASLVERRSAPRYLPQLNDRHERARRAAKASEFASIATFGALLAVIALAAIGEALAEPLSELSAALIPK